MDLGHYTSAQGLLGIYESKTLRATNIKYLNDEHEFQHALDLIREIISKTEVKKTKPHEKLFESFIGQVTQKLSTLENYTTESIFTLSFSEKTDLLSQWRGYCPNNDGYCLHFDIDKVFEAAADIFKECQFLKCIYKNDIKEREIKKVLNNHWQQFMSGDKAEAVIESFRKQVLLLASHFKHPSFEEEAEHRIVVFLEKLPDARVKFRQGRHSLVPYLEIPISTLDSVKKITIGPTLRKDLAKRGLQAFLETSTMEPFFMLETEIQVSGIPYRS